MSQKFKHFTEPTSFRRGDVLWHGNAVYAAPLDENGDPQYNSKLFLGFSGMRGRKLYRTRSKYTPHQNVKEMMRRVKWAA